MNFFDSINHYLWALFATIGGMAKYLDGYVRGTRAPSFSHFFAQAFVSGFSGYMFANVMVMYSPDWAYIAAGLGGFMGTQALDWILDIVKAKAGIPEKHEPKDKKK